MLSKYVPRDNPSKKLGVETFSDMLAEVRKYGESLIIVDQIPDKLTPEVLKNTNTKIVHKLFAADDKNAIGNTMALNDEQKEFLSNLEVGRAIVSNQDFAKPLQVQIKELDNVSTTSSKLVDEKEIRNIALRYYQQNYKRGIIQGLEVLEHEPSFEDIEEFLGSKIHDIVKAWEKHCRGDMNEALVFDFKTYLEKNKLIDKQALIINYLLNKFYILNTDDDKISISRHIETMFSCDIKDENKFTLEEKRYLRIR